MNRYVLGIDLGSSSVKASLLDLETGKVVAAASEPATEMPIIAVQTDWAEQDPATWWQHTTTAVRRVIVAAAGKAPAAIGISYQMHGLVAIDRNGNVLRPSIIWCDSRAVAIGDTAYAAIGPEVCRRHVMNSPGNFTAAKLAWVKAHEPRVFDKIWKILLPGDYLAYRMTGTACTTPSGLSEGILWDVVAERPSALVLDHFGFQPELLADVVPSFGDHGRLTAAAAAELGLPTGVPVTYRAGDQPNNAFSLNVLEPGELATTAGTSGVVYGVVSQPAADVKSRVNTFVHVNHRADHQRYGVLMCLNGTGILNRWLRSTCCPDLGYDDMNRVAANVEVGSRGLRVYPFGNGAERTLENQNPGAWFENLNFNIHERAHLIAAGQEGVVFALNYGIEIMRAMGIQVSVVRAGHANMFLSPLFQTAFASLTGARIELLETDGAQGAARGAAVGAGLFGPPNQPATLRQAFGGLTRIAEIAPDPRKTAAYTAAYDDWRRGLAKRVGGV